MLFKGKTISQTLFKFVKDSKFFLDLFHTNYFLKIYAVIKYI